MLTPGGHPCKWFPILLSQVLIEQYLSIYGESVPAIFNSTDSTATASNNAAASSSSGAEDDGGGVRKVSVASTRSNASSGNVGGGGVGKSEFYSNK